MEILKMIFSEKTYDIKASEEPDFILKYKEFNSEFGVEITELYRDESNARLSKIDNYIDIIINPESRNRKPNKGDLQKLNVEEFSYISPENKVINQKGIALKCLTSTEKSKIISKCINTKEKKLKNYMRNTKENYLVIYDKELCLYGEKSHMLYDSISGKELFDALCSSKFNEIFFVTQSSNKQTYSGLISLHFVNTFSRAISFANDYYKSSEERLDCSLNIVYNLGFRFKMTYDDRKDKYYLIYHDCVIEFCDLYPYKFCICQIYFLIPTGNKNTNSNSIDFIGNYNKFLKEYDFYKRFIINNEVRFYEYSRNVL